MIPLMTDAERIAWVLARAAECVGVSAEEITSESRYQRPALARQIACYVLRKQMLPLATIGRGLHRDHSTVHHAITRIEQLIRSDAEVSAMVEYVAILPDAPVESDVTAMLESLVTASGHLGSLIDQQMAFLQHLRAVSDGVKRQIAADLAAAATVERMRRYRVVA